VVYKLGEASAAEVREGMADPPGYSAVRATLKILEDKGELTHAERDGRYVYKPVVAAGKARTSAVKRLLDTFFAGSAADAVAALLGNAGAKFTGEELDRLSELIEKHKKGTRK
jgi:predicted transcriptional regulator